MSNSPAFPVPSDAQDLGLTMRDYFAAKAMQGFCTDNGYNSMESIAKDAYTLADAMLKERGK